MRASTKRLGQVQRELADNECIERCARRFGTTGDKTRMKICYLLRHHPELTVSQIAKLVGVSVSTTSRSLKKLQEVEVVTSRKEAQTVWYSMEDNEFTRMLKRELAV